MTQIILSVLGEVHLQIPSIPALAATPTGYDFKAIASHKTSDSE